MENACPANGRFAASTDFVRKPCHSTANRTLSEFNGKADKSYLMTLIGYARVSTGDQHTALQLDALRKAGCEKLFEDRASGVRADRPGLAGAIRYAREGDTLTVWKLDRLGRSMKHLIEIITELESKASASDRSPKTSTPRHRVAAWSSICLARWHSSSAI